jgi:hypothetical protein
MQNFRTSARYSRPLQTVQRRTKNNVSTVCGYASLSNQMYRYKSDANDTFTASAIETFLRGTAN